MPTDHISQMYRDMATRAQEERRANSAAEHEIAQIEAMSNSRVASMQRELAEQEEIIKEALNAIERVRNNYLKTLRAITQTNDVRMIHQLAQQMIDAAPKPQAQQQPVQIQSAPAPAKKGFVERIFGG